jgi:hypothetical protein
MTYLLFVILSSFFVAFGQAEQIKTITVEPFMSTENYEHFKRLVLNSSDSQAQYIEGFEFDWGYRYSLRVKQTTIGPLSDGTMYDYSLIETISKTKVADSTTFTMSVDPLRYYENQANIPSNNTLKILNNTTYLYMDLVELEVPQKEHSRFQMNINNGVSFFGDFHFVNERRIRLIQIK